MIHEKEDGTKVSIGANGQETRQLDERDLVPSSNDAGKEAAANPLNLVIHNSKIHVIFDDEASIKGFISLLNATGIIRGGKLYQFRYRFTNKNSAYVTAAIDFGTITPRVVDRSLKDNGYDQLRGLRG